ncbi:MAG: bifunctional proline dehydrogenase/L-glutamate gamma-semialdehyde dehydrogenase [Simkaniaceae bacterium]
MPNKEKESQHIILSRDLISSVRGRNLTSHEREKKAIELASYILAESIKEETPSEKKKHAQLARMMHDPNGKAFTTAMTDECFRSENKKRIANQMIHLIDLFGIPEYLAFFKRLQLKLFRMYGEKFARLVVPLAVNALRKETESVIIPGEASALKRHIEKRSAEGVRLNLNHLGEAILGEEEAKSRLDIYLKDLENPDINYVSIKVSTIFSQINLVAYEETILHLAERLRKLYRHAMQHPFVNEGGEKISKFVNLDMEEYRDLFLTKDLFMKVLDEEEFLQLEAGIVLQAYVPDSHLYQMELTEWAKKRMNRGGAPIKIRIVKGANMAMEMVESALHGWAQAPYKMKMETDSNYKRMVNYALEPENAHAVHIGIASHNLFDIAYALLLRTENGVEKEISFEMLEGMAEHMQRVVQKLSGGLLLYCAIATRKDFQSAIAYLIRRLDENTGLDNFLRHSFGLKPHSASWELQAALFSEACSRIDQVELNPRRNLDRNQAPKPFSIESEYEADHETDFALPRNREWGQKILKTWTAKKIDPIPLVIAGKTLQTDEVEEGFDPSVPETPLYSYHLAGELEVEQALSSAKKAQENLQNMGVKKRVEILASCAHEIRKRRADILGAMIIDGGKTLIEADVELCEGIDFIEYYLRQMLKIDAYEDIEHRPKGTVLITPPWNFPVSIPIGGVSAAFASGNAVLFKPAPESVLAGYIFCQAFWDAGFPKEALQFINCKDEPMGSKLIQDERVDLIILTGATSTAKAFLKMRPKLDLSAETGGKNALIITAMSDRDQAIKDLVRSAFGHSGQKCSACSLGILEKEVYYDPQFRRQLKDAVESLPVGSAHDSRSIITPLIRSPGNELKRGLTTLEKGESWLVEPKADLNNPNLVSPGVKLGVVEGSYSHQTEFFGPILGLMCANDLDHALSLANGTPYGLTSGIHSLDDREQQKWQSKIIAGNCYINRSITGAIVERQPFGGTKNSSFGPGKKAGGPHYLNHFLHIKQKGVPKEKFPVNEWINNLTGFLEKFELTTEDLGLWMASISSYAFWWEHYRRPKDPTKLIGQDNLLIHTPYKKMCLRVEENDNPIDYIRVFAAALTCQVPLQVSWSKKGKTFPPRANWGILLPFFNFYEESEEELIRRIRSHEITRLRTLSPPSDAIYEIAAETGCFINKAEVLANGYFELPHYLREISLSADYHRYGNLGTRENEMRRNVP